MALQSMTGYARDAGEHGGWSWVWELKSVNAKGLDARLRLPPGFDFLDPEVRARLPKRFKRGHVTVSLALTRSEAETRYRINEAHLDTLIAAVGRVAGALPVARPPSVDGLLGLRGVIEAEDEGIDDAERAALGAALMASFDTAAVGLATVRGEEGKRLDAVLTGFLDDLAALRDTAAGAEETRAETIRARLVEQVRDLVADVGQLDPARLEQEVAILLTKADIREEIDRLGAHIGAVQELMAAGAAVGRRLDFLCQELNREANTICSKAQDAALTRVGLDMKAVIEQFREQVQNIE